MPETKAETINQIFALTPPPKAALSVDRLEMARRSKALVSRATCSNISELPRVQPVPDEQEVDERNEVLRLSRLAASVFVRDNTAELLTQGPIAR